VTKLGWAVDIRTHGIRQIVERLLAEDWEPPLEGGVGREVPEFSSEEDCIVRLASFIVCMCVVLTRLKRIVSIGNTVTSRMQVRSVGHVVGCREEHNLLVSYVTFIKIILVIGDYPF
jgi:hypothetical protein